MGDDNVTCLRVQNSGAATVGTERGVYYLDLIENTSPEVFYIVFAPWLDGSDRTDCTQATSGDTTGFVDQRLWGVRRPIDGPQRFDPRRPLAAALRRA